MSEVELADPAVAAPSATREIAFEHSKELAAFLGHLKLSVLISTYQAGKLVALTPGSGELAIKFMNFDRPMGIAVGTNQIAVGARNQIWVLRSAPDVARRAEPVGQYDACYLARSAHVTGDVQGHEMAWAGDELWLVNTLFSCLCTLSGEFSFVPRWKPTFISSIVAEDRCHLNGMALSGGRPKLVTFLGATDTPRGWRPDKAGGGRLIDVDSGETLLRDLCMPHSPRLYQGQIWLLDSGRGQLVLYTSAAGERRVMVTLPGYTRGLAFFRQYAFIGLSRIRETSTFDGIPIAEDRDALKCGLWIVDVTRGQTVMFFEFKSGVEEIFDVQLLPGVHSPLMRGPSSLEDEEQTIWTAPGLRPLA